MNRTKEAYKRIQGEITKTIKSCYDKEKIKKMVEELVENSAVELI